MHEEETAAATREHEFPDDDDDELVARQVAGEPDRRVDAMILSRDVVVEAWLEGRF